MKNNRLTVKLLIAVAVLGLAVAAASVYFYYRGIASSSAAASAQPTVSVTPEATPSAIVSTAPSPSPSVTPTPSAKPTPTPTAAPTPTPTALPEITWSMSESKVTSDNGASVSVTVTADIDTAITVTSTDGITTWYEPGYLFIYPTQSGSVTVTAARSGYQSSSRSIDVTVVISTPAPAATGAAAEDDTLLTPNVSRDEDLTFWFRGCMSDTKEMFFQTADSYGVDPFLAIAIADHETGYGGSDACTAGNNFGGLIGSDGIKTFASKQEGIDALMYLLQYYHSKGRVTVAQIAAWYCPGEPQESTWVSRVTTIYNSFHQQ